MGRRRAILLSLLGVGMLILAACSSSSGSGSAGASGGGQGSTTVTGSLPSFHYPAPGGGNGGATAQGVTATTINLGQVMSITGPLPGIANGQIRAAQAYYNWVNANGGIYGRKIKVKVVDDGFDPTKDATVCTALIPQSFALVANQSAVISGCAAQVKATGIPFVGYMNTAVNILYPLPNAYDCCDGPGASVNQLAYNEMKKQFPSVTKVGFLWPTFMTQVFVNAFSKAYETAGMQVVFKQFYSTTTPNLAPYVVAMRKAGVQAVDLTGAGATVSAHIQQIMAQQGWHPEFIMNGQAYVDNWGQLAGAGAANTASASDSPPYLDASDIEHTSGGRLFVEENQKYYPGQPIDTYTWIGWEEAALFVEAAVMAGPDLTWTKLDAALRSIHNFTNNGMQGATDVGNKQYPACYVDLIYKNGSWQRLYPTTPGTYACP